MGRGLTFCANPFHHHGIVPVTKTACYVVYGMVWCGVVRLSHSHLTLHSHCTHSAAVCISVQQQQEEVWGESEEGRSDGGVSRVDTSRWWVTRKIAQCTILLIVQRYYQTTFFSTIHLTSTFTTSHLHPDTFSSNTHYHLMDTVSTTNPSSLQWLRSLVPLVPCRWVMILQTKKRWQLCWSIYEADLSGWGSWYPVFSYASGCHYQYHWRVFTTLHWK